MVLGFGLPIALLCDALLTGAAIRTPWYRPRRHTAVGEALEGEFGRGDVFEVHAVRPLASLLPPRATLRRGSTHIVAVEVTMANRGLVFRH
jgi:hypothetical protein